MAGKDQAIEWKKIFAMHISNNEKNILTPKIAKEKTDNQIGNCQDIKKLKHSYIASRILERQLLCKTF